VSRTIIGAGSETSLFRLKWSFMKLKGSETHL